MSDALTCPRRRPRLTPTSGPRCRHCHQGIHPRLALQLATALPTPMQAIIDAEELERLTAGAESVSLLLR